MKRLIALLLVGILALGLAAPVSAAGGAISLGTALQGTVGAPEGASDSGQPEEDAIDGQTPQEEGAEPPAGDEISGADVAPTETPAAEPTETPAAEPTETPAAEPTETPAAEPTETPEPEPTETPAAEPTETPAAEPTETPAAEPTETPEPEPTETPMAEPTETPMAEPTETPAAEPTETPAAEPPETPEPEPTETPEPEADPFMLISDLPASVGQVDISVTKALDLGDWTPSFEVSLCGGGFFAALTVEADGVCGSFHDVPAGDYALTVSGQGFATYTQDVHLALSDGMLIKLTAGRLAGYDSGAHPGVLQIGDVDGSGTLDDVDASLMMQAVDLNLAAEGGASSVGFTDLNRDGVTDLADAEYLAKGMDLNYLDAAVKAATAEHYIPETAVAVSASQDTETSGMENLFLDNSQPFTLARKSGEQITGTAPVSMSFDMADGAQSDVILLDETNILSGEIEIIYADGSTAESLIGDAPAADAIAAEDGQTPSDAVVDVPEPEPVPVEPAAEEAPADTEPVQQDTPEDVPEVAPEVAPEADSEPFADGIGLLSEVVIEVPELPKAEAPGAVVSVTQDASGKVNIQVDLGGKKAVKRVVLKITGTTDAGYLASISQVEFVNGMEDRIPEPALDKPVNVAAVGGSRQFTVSWSPCVNITGYAAEVAADGVTEVFALAGTSLTVTRFNNDEVRNYTTYQVRVRSVNGAWTSAWSEAVSVTPRPVSVPDKPDNVKAEGGYESVTVSWKNMKDTTSYDLFYKEQSQDSYALIPDLTVTSYEITGLDSTKPTSYEVYVVGKNEFGSSAPSMHACAVTVCLDPADMPRFNLINRNSAGAPGADHILSAVQDCGVMVGSPLDSEGGTAWGTVDGNGASYYDRRTWDDGGYNNLSANIGLIYTFDQPYLMDTIGMMSVEPGMDYTYIKIRWWDAEGGEHYIDRTAMRSEKRMDSAGRTYFFLRLPEPVLASRIQIGVARYWAGNNRITVSEVYFYQYDSLKGELAALYADDLHTMLAAGVTEERLNELKGRIESSVDAFGEVNPDKEQLLREWETAWKIYHDQFLGTVTRIHTGITASGDEHGFGGLNAWQPLGVIAAAGETVTVYVGNSAMKTGSNTSLQLVVTQYHAEASAMSKVLTTLKVGANEVRIPKIWTTTGVESGGALYVQYTGGASAADDYAVRVSGGVAVPVLDLYKVGDAGERMSRTAAYLEQLSAYAAGIPTLHSQMHQGDGAVSREVNYDYDEQNCILGATDIMLDTMMLSLPAKQVVSGCAGNAQTLLASLDAMEEMMGLFYQHKGLNSAAPNAVDRIPSRHLNIRYQRMFSGAFMYASGDHIGIGWNETDDMAGCQGVKKDANGLYGSGSYFGWGIAHEIGHDINQGAYAIAEITNNYFAVLAQARDTNDSVRFDYDNVYAKVTSGTRGSSANVFTQLAMYWQLHLAYDKGYNFRTYDDYDQQLANLFFARVDTYARTPDRAPGPKVALTLNGADVDQALMRLACAAAERDLLEFFQRWGMVPDETTVAYASQFPKETRAVYYVCDDSRRYTLESGGVSKLSADGSTEAIAAVTAEVDRDQANKVDITVTPSAALSQQEILGYEIVRCTISGGKLEKRTVGFTTGGTFTDVVYAMNNRAVYYEVTLVDKYLNRSAAAPTGTVKIQHEGDLDKASWTVTTAALTADPSDVGTTGGDEAMPEVMEEDVALRMVDGRVETVYNATVGADACIELDFHDTQVITGFRYTAGSGTPIGGYVVDVHQSGEWIRAAEGELNASKSVYFSNADGKYVSTYAADALRLTLTGDQAGSMISVAEIDVLGLTGDNVDFGRGENGAASIGYLSKAYQYGEEKDDFIPARSLVFTGSYKGNAAYNVVMLYDQDGNVVAGAAADGSRMAYQTILSDVPKTGKIQDTTEGIWIYWIQPEDQTIDFTLPKKVRVELYRVNNAQTNEGERLVSDSVFVDVPAEPGDITLGGIG